jgi:hypothetical protein
MMLVVAVARGVAQTPAATVKPGPNQQKFAAFVGTWTYEGDAKASVFGPAGKITGTDVFELLPGGFFVQHRWDEKNPLGNVKGTEIWGYDALKKQYMFTYFSSVGEMGSGPMTVAGNVWSTTSTGVSYDGKPTFGRCTGTLTGTTMLVWKCDASADGKVWAASFEGRWTKK